MSHNLWPWLLLVFWKYCKTYVYTYVSTWNDLRRLNIVSSNPTDFRFDHGYFRFPEFPVSRFRILNIMSPNLKIKTKKRLGRSSLVFFKKLKTWVTTISKSSSGPAAYAATKKSWKFYAQILETRKNRKLVPGMLKIDITPPGGFKCVWKLYRTIVTTTAFNLNMFSITT